MAGYTDYKMGVDTSECPRIRIRTLTNENGMNHSSIHLILGFFFMIRPLNQAARLQPKMKHGGELLIVWTKCGRVNQLTKYQWKGISWLNSMKIK